MTDPIADYLTRLRNAISAKHRVVEVPASNLKKEITKILFDKGYILNYKFVEDGPQGTIKVALKYDSVNKVNAIKKLIRVSTPGLRKYTGYKDMPRVINGLGIATGLLPAYGFALLLKMMVNKNNITFFILGFALAVYMKIPVTGVAIFGACLALILTGYSAFKDKFHAEPAAVSGNSTTNSGQNGGIDYEDEEF